MPSAGATAHEELLTRAAYLQQKGRPSEAHTLLKAHMKTLPADIDDYIRPPLRRDLQWTAFDEQCRWRMIRIGYLEQLALLETHLLNGTTSAAQAQHTHPGQAAHTAHCSPRSLQATLLELARSAPFASPHWHAVQAPSPVARKVKIAAGVIDGAGLSATRRYRFKDTQRTPLPPEQLAMLTHPVTRQDNMWGRFQSMLAKMKIPDRSFIRDFCERADAQQYPQLLAAITTAAQVLGTHHIDCYISRGVRSTGLRSYDDKKSPFLLIGHAHCIPKNPHYLPQQALLFAIGAEMAHIHFKHSRVTSAELYDGMWDKGLKALSLATFMLPVFKYLPMEKLLGKKALLLKASAKGISVAKSGLATTRKQLNRMDKKKAQKAPPNEQDTSLSPAQQQLVAAHRIMQLTADRAGLVICRDLPSAVHAVFATAPRYHELYAQACRTGLLPIVFQQGEQEQHAYPELGTRLEALIGFYLSDEYDHLTREQALRT